MKAKLYLQLSICMDHRHILVIAWAQVPRVGCLHSCKLEIHLFYNLYFVHLWIMMLQFGHRHTQTHSTHITHTPHSFTYTHTHIQLAHLQHTNTHTHLMVARLHEMMLNVKSYAISLTNTRVRYGNC